MIPRIVFTYWEGDQLSELHYLTIYSLHKYNPELDIIIYTDYNPKNILREWKSHEHSIDIKKKITLSKLIEVNPNKIFLRTINFQKEYNFDNNISIVFKADFIRIAKLYEHGGIWFDMDILFIKPIPDFFFKDDVNLFIFIYSSVIPTGFLVAKQKSKYLEILYNNSLKIIKNKELNNYQKIGPIIWIEEYNNLSDTEKMNIKILDNNLVYPILWNELDYLFKMNTIKINENTFGIHWYNGDPITKEFINIFDLNNINPEKSLFEELVYRMYNNLESKHIENIFNIIINSENINNLEKLQNEFYNKALNNINNSIIIYFNIPVNLLKTKAYTFYKCWKNGYCLNNSLIKLPKNIKRIHLKKI
jgi:hypothetical protein